MVRGSFVCLFRELEGDKGGVLSFYCGFGDRFFSVCGSTHDPRTQPECWVYKFAPTVSDDVNSKGIK